MSTPHAIRFLPSSEHFRQHPDSIAERLRNAAVQRCLARLGALRDQPPDRTGWTWLPANSPEQVEEAYRGGRCASSLGFGGSDAGSAMTVDLVTDHNEPIVELWAVGDERRSTDVLRSVETVASARTNRKPGEFSLTRRAFALAHIGSLAIPLLRRISASDGMLVVRTGVLTTNELTELTTEELSEIEQETARLLLRYGARFFVRERRRLRAELSLVYGVPGD